MVALNNEISSAFVDRLSGVENNCIEKLKLFTLKTFFFCYLFSGDKNLFGNVL